MTAEERSIMLGTMDVKRLVFKLAIPAIIAMFANALYNLVDTLFVAWDSGEIAIGALAIAFPVQLVILALGLMIGIGSASIFSRAYGRGDAETMKRSVMTALTMTLFISSTLTVLGLIFLNPLLRLFGATASNIGFARDYLGFIMISLIPYSGSLVLTNLTRAEGRAGIAMKSLLIGAIVNIVLDPIFIFPSLLGIPLLDLGVTGAAIATLIAKTLAFAYILYHALSKDSALMINLRYIFKIDMKMVLEIFTIGMPTFIRNVLGAVLVIIVNQLINQYAPNDPAIYISIYGVITRLITFLLLPGIGLVQGLQPIVGFNYGAKKIGRLMQSITFSLLLITIYFFTMSGITVLFSESFFVLFSRDADAFFIAEGGRAFRIIALGFGLIGFQIMMSSIYQAMGDAKRALFIALLRQFILFVPLAFIFSSLFGLNGIWLTFVVADALAGLISVAFYFHQAKQFKRELGVVPT